jgi:uncharacterized membrane protein YoaK (UPF0700 family)
MATDRSGGPDTGTVTAPNDTGAPGADRWLFAGLFVLTAVTGVVDATSYLGLGRVFTANMTGNVLLLGFDAAGRSTGAHPQLLAGLLAPARSGRRLATVGLLFAGAALGAVVEQAGVVWCVTTALAMVVVGAVAVVRGLRR